MKLTITTTKSSTGATNFLHHLESITTRVQNIYHIKSSAESRISRPKKKQQKIPHFALNMLLRHISV